MTSLGKRLHRPIHATLAEDFWPNPRNNIFQRCASQFSPYDLLLAINEPKFNVMWGVHSIKFLFLVAAASLFDDIADEAIGFLNQGVEEYLDDYLIQYYMCQAYMANEDTTVARIHLYKGYHAESGGRISQRKAGGCFISLSWEINWEIRRDLTRLRLT